ncbi:hypothetical protein ACFL6C_01265 [Myxococcota bacterium]
MKRCDRQQVCHTILANAGVRDYCLADSTRLVVPDLDTLTTLQHVAVRMAAAIWSGRLDPEVATLLGLA